MKKRLRFIEPTPPRELPTPPDGLFWEVRTVLGVAELHLRRNSFFGSRVVDWVGLHPQPGDELSKRHVIEAGHRIMDRYESKLQYEAAAARLEQEVAEAYTLHRRSNR